MEFDFKNMMELSRLSSRGVYGKALSDITQANDNIMAVVADVMTSSKLEEFCKKFPDKFINVGIAEQNMISVSAGLASEGYNVFASTFAPFASMRCFEQLRTQVGYMNLNVKVVGLLSGFSGGVVGNTHYGLEDIALTRTIPNMTVISPADCVETYKVIEALKNYIGPCYVRLTGVNGTPNAFKENYEFKIGKAIQMTEGEDIAVIATGTMVYEAMRTARALKKNNILVSVYNFHTIKPLDYETLDKIFSKYKLLVTIEEHFKIGGLGSAVAEYKSDKKAPPQLIIGVEDKFEKAGEYNYMLDKTGLTAPKIAEKILKKLEEI